MFIDVDKMTYHVTRTTSHAKKLSQVKIIWLEDELGQNPKNSLTRNSPMNVNFVTLHKKVFSVNFKFDDTKEIYFAVSVLITSSAEKITEGQNQQILMFSKQRCMDATDCDYLSKTQYNTRKI